MNKITACMIIKNEGDKIYNTLSSIYDCFDEFVIIDTGSTDNTTSEVNRFIQDQTKVNYRATKRFICDYFKWINDFSAARNFSFSKATCDFVTWWDADDKMTEPLKRFLTEFRKFNKYWNTNVVRIPTVIAYDDSGKPTRFVDNTRIIRRELNPVWQYRIHEQLLFNQRPDGDIWRTNLDKGEFVEAIKDYSNTHHLNFYKNLVNEGYEMNMHDLYFFLHEMIITNNFDWWDWYIKTLKETLNKPTKYPGYPGMLYNMIRAFYSDFFNTKFNTIKLDILNQQLRAFGEEPRLCFWLGEFFEGFGYESIAKYWYKIGSTANNLPDYEQYDIKFFQNICSEQLTRLNEQ